MTAPTPRSPWVSVLQVAALLAALAAAVPATIAADRDFREIMPPGTFTPTPGVSRPSWFWSLQGPFARFHNDLLAPLSVLTLGAAGALALDRRSWRRRGPVRAGAVAVAVASVVVAMAAVRAADGPPMANGIPSFWISLQILVATQAAGAVLAAWLIVVLAGLWRPCADWRDVVGRLVGWGWLGTIGLTIGYPFLFG